MSRTAERPGLIALGSSTDRPTTTAWPRYAPRTSVHNRTDRTPAHSPASAVRRRPARSGATLGPQSCTPNSPNISR